MTFVLFSEYSHFTVTCSAESSWDDVTEWQKPTFNPETKVGHLD